MSRGQSTQAFNTASNENATDFGNAQSAFGSTENAIGNYNNQLAKFVSGNPYTPGGEYDQTINTGLANVSDAGSNSLQGALQSQALRTGQNSAADAATRRPRRSKTPATYRATWPKHSSSASRAKLATIKRLWAHRPSQSAPTSPSTVGLRMQPIALWAMRRKQPRRPASGMRLATALPAI